MHIASRFVYNGKTVFCFRSSMCTCMFSGVGDPLSNFSAKKGSVDCKHISETHHCAHEVLCGRKKNICNSVDYQLNDSIQLHGLHYQLQTQTTKSCLVNSR